MKYINPILNVIGILAVCLIFLTLPMLLSQLIISLSPLLHDCYVYNLATSDSAINYTDTVSVIGLFALCYWGFGGKAVLHTNWINFSPVKIPTLIILGTCMFFPIGLAEDIICLPDYLKDDFESVGINTWDIFYICLMGPFVEELLFRGIIMNRLLEKNIKPNFAISITAILFALFHLNPAQMIGALIVGLFVGYLAYKTNCIYYSILTHCVYNTLCYIQHYLLGYDSKTIELVNGNWIIYILLAILCIYIGNFILNNYLIKFK